MAIYSYCLVCYRAALLGHSTILSLFPHLLQHFEEVRAVASRQLRPSQENRSGQGVAHGSQEESTQGRSNRGGRMKQ